jgi:hypothetical protein
MNDPELPVQVHAALALTSIIDNHEQGEYQTSMIPVTSLTASFSPHHRHPADRQGHPGYVCIFSAIFEPLAHTG